MNRAVHSRGLPGSMRGTLVLLVLAVLLPLLGVQAGIYTAWYHTRWGEQERATLETAREAASIFEAYIRDVRRQELAIGAALTGPRAYATDEANRFLTAAGRDYLSIHSWNWTDREGAVIASTHSKMIGLKLGDRAYFKELRSGRSSVVSDMLVDRLNGAHIFVIASRIDDRKGSLAGAVVATAEVTDLGQHAVALYRTISEEITLFDRQGTLVYSSQGRRDLFQDWRTFDPLLAGALQSGTERVGVIDLTNDAEVSEKYIAARVPIPNTGWVAGARRSVAKAMASVYAGLWIAGGLNLLVVAASAGLAWLTAGNFIHQLHRLQAHAQAIGRGEFTHVAESTNMRELADLATAFNQMGTAVGAAQQAERAVNASLEQRIADRTAELNKAGESLRAERQRFQDVLDMLPAYVVLLTPDYHVPFANRFFRERFGESNGQRCYEYLFHRTEPCEKCDTYTVLKTMAPHHWEWTGPDGHNYDISDFPFTDRDGSTLILEMGIDVTEQKRAEAELEKHRHHLEELVQERTGQLEAANAQLRTVFDVVNVGMLLINEHGAVKRVNNTLSRWLGRDLATCLDNQPGDMIACVHALADPAGCGSTPYCQQCSIRNAFQSALRSGQPVHDVETTATVAIDGHEARLWLEVSADPLTLAGKRHVILALSNITARKQAEAEILRRAEELKTANDELEHFNRVMVDREIRMIDLKKQVNDLCVQVGKPPRYPLDFEKEPS